ncbi:NADH-quinone oxidoreductase subunit A [Solitalea koreensis]|uniref:NADH-quinone oxidoreductase subunit n=2 Tax=Solitalea koreensis TaxID=543615 RepID=A0A521B9L5_9SPHI|nr:NADH-quinone oxidoreductase subunit A [Solitalea koreensis]
MSSLISPHKPNPEKLTSYECGEEPTGNSWMQFNMRFYVVALVFLLFDVELVFLFPWATVFGQKALIAAEPAWGWLSFIEMSIFIAILLIGLLYVWKKGDIDWIKPQPLIPVVDVKVPMNLYAELNTHKHQLRAFDPQTLKEAAVKIETVEPITVSPRKALFKSAMAGKLGTNEVEKTITESSPANEPVSEKPGADKPASAPYKPKFKPQLNKSTIENNQTVNEGTELKPEEKTSENKTVAPYKPKFKPQILKKPDEAKEKTHSVNEVKEEIKEETKPATAPYKPKFRPQMLKKTDEAKDEESTPMTNETKEEVQDEKKTSTPYKPKFRPQLLKKPEQASNTEDASDVKNED